MPKPKRAPRWCYWRGETLWLRIVVNGKEVRESLRTGSVELARKRAEETRARLIGAMIYGEEVKLWEDAVAGWSATISDAVSARTALRYGQSIKAIMKYFAGKPIARICMDDIDAMVSGRRAETYQREGSSKVKKVTAATIRRDLTAVASVLDYAIDRKWREGNPARDKSRRVKEKKHLFVLPPVEDIEAVLAPLTGGLEDLARFAWVTGMRLSEITSIDRRWIRGSLLHFRGKGSKGRTIELDDDAQKIAGRQPVSTKTTKLFHHEGQPYRNVSSNFSRAVRKAQKTAQKEGRDFTFFTFHGLRHIFAIEALRSSRFGLYELSQHLGHGSVQITEDTYLEYLTAEQVKSAKDGTLDGTRATVADVPKQA